MGRFSVFVVAVLLAVTPAVIGLFGNASFSTDVPVRVPSRATLLDQHSDRRRHPGADRESLRSGRGNPAGVLHPVGQGAGGQS